MSDWHNYKENLAYEPQGDWSETQPKPCTERTPQVLELIDRVAKLEKKVEIAKKYLSLIKRNVPINSLVYTYAENAKTEIKELDK